MPKVHMKCARTAKTDPAGAADELLSAIGDTSSTKLVTLFGSYDRDHRALNKAVRERLPKETRLVGATSSGEVDRDGIHQSTVVLGALGGDFDVGLGLGRDLGMDAYRAGVD